MKLLHVTTVPSTLRFLEGQSTRLREEGIEVQLLSSPGEELEEIARREGVLSAGVEMSRSISPVLDLVSLVRLVRTLRKIRPDILHAHTPKAGLLATTAGRLTGVPVCIYQIHGLRYTTTTGLRRLLLTSAERVACLLAQQVLSVSPSILETAEYDRIIRPGKGAVIGSGTINGVDVAAFDPAPHLAAASAARSQLGIPAEAPVVGFIGRLVADKGIEELAEAWRTVRERTPRAHLLLVGEAEDGDPVPPGAMQALAEDPTVHFAGQRADVRPLLAAMTVLTLPSYREGFGQTLLEASAMGVATVGSDIPGIRDAIVDGDTGLLVPAKDAGALAACLIKLLEDPDMCTRLGRAGRRRALAEFDRETVRELFLAHYLRSVPAGRPARAGVLAFADRKARA